MTTAENDAAQNMCKLVIASRLIREVFTTLPTTQAERNAILTPLCKVMQEQRRIATCSDAPAYVQGSPGVPEWQRELEATK